MQTLLDDPAALAVRLEKLAQENAQLRERLDRRAQRDRVLNRINTRIRTSLNDVSAILRTAVEELGHSLHAARCWVLLYPATNLERLFEYAAPQAPPRPDLPQQVTPRPALPGLLACPIMLQHEIFGFLFVHRPQQADWASAEVELVEQAAGELAVALENARLLAEGEQRAKDIERLLAVAQTANLERNPQRLVERLIEQAMPLIAAQGALVARVVGDEVVVDRLFRGGCWADSGLRLPAGQGVLGWVLAHRRPYLSHEAAGDALVPPEWEQRFGVRTLLCVPMIGRQGQIEGMLEWHNRAEGGRFSDHDVERAQTVAQQAALALENVRLFEEVQERAATLEMLLTFGEDLNYQADPALLIRRVVERAVALVSARGGLGALLDEGGLACDGYWHAAHGEWQALALRWPAGHGLAGSALEMKRPYMTNDYRREPRAAADLIEAFDPHSAVCVPLCDSEGSVLGFFEVHDKADLRTPFSWADAALLDSLANMAAVAIGNARLFRQLEDQRAQLRTLSNQLIQAMEAERRRIARELHDEAGQLLYGLYLHLNVLVRNIPAEQDDLRSQATEIRDLMEVARKKIRKLSHDLRPATLDELGLVPALQQLVGDFGGDAGLAASFEAPGVIGRLDPQIEIACYRIVQEALTNVVRHAQAQNVWVILAAQDGQVQLSVRDDGRGFDPHGLPSKGMGLLGIQERAISLRARVGIHSRPGQGTRLDVVFEA